MLAQTLLPALVAFAGFASAQVETDCDPRERDCPADPAFGTSALFNFNETADSDFWETRVRGIDYDSETGARFTLKKGQSPNIRFKYYFFGGRTDVVMKAAPGKGIISSMMWLSDDLDEVDWEFIGVNDTHASSNYFGKGDEDWTNAGWHLMSGIQADYHNYSCVWGEESLKWYIDGEMVRELHAKDANNTQTYPQTPMRLSLALWAGGDPGLPEGTRQWAGGDVDYDGGPYEMFVKSVYIEDGHQGVKEYKYTDRSGSWGSIEAVEGNSTAYEMLNKEPEDTRTVSEKWEEDVSPTAKTAVYAGAAAVGAAVLGGLLFYCIRQRRRGAKEAALAAQRNADEAAELDRFKREGRDPDAFVSHGAEYNAQEMGSKNVTVVESSPFVDQPDEKARGVAGAAAGAGGAGAFAMRPIDREGSQSPRMPPPGQNPFDDSQRTPSCDHFSPAPQDPFNSGAAPSPYRDGSPVHSQMSRSQSPMIRQQSPASPPAGPLPAVPGHRGSPGAGSMRGSPGPEGMPVYRSSPGPAGMQRMQSPGPQSMSPSARSFSEAYQGGGGYGSSRMQNKSPGPGTMGVGGDRSVSQPQGRGYGGPPGPQQNWPGQY